MLDLSSMTFTWRDGLDIGLVAFIFYRVILLVKGTRAVSVIIGLLLLVLAYALAGQIGLYTLHWLLANFLGSIFLVIIILFQRDIRSALSEMGAHKFWRKTQVGEETLNDLIAAMFVLAKGRIGALVVLEKNVALGDVVERGVSLKAKLSRELLVTIFFPNTPLHDGAAIVRGDEIVAAGCILPLSTAVKIRSEYGTRHRAAMGITEECDAVAVVVSEERGEVSVALRGKLIANVDEAKLRRIIIKALEN